MQLCLQGLEYDQRKLKVSKPHIQAKMHSPIIDRHLLQGFSVELYMPTHTLCCAEGHGNQHKSIHLPSCYSQTRESWSKRNQWGPVASWIQSFISPLTPIGNEQAASRKTNLKAMLYLCAFLVDCLLATQPLLIRTQKSRNSRSFCIARSAITHSSSMPCSEVPIRKTTYTVVDILSSMEMRVHENCSH